MAIIIPSKNTYTTNNPKVRDNVVDNVSVETSLPSVVITVEQPFADTILGVEDTFGQDGFYQESVVPTPTSTGAAPNLIWTIHGAYISIAPYYTSASILVNRRQKNTVITKLYSGKDKDGNNNITYTVTYMTYKGTASGTLTHDNGKFIATDIKTTYGEPEKDLISGSVVLEDSYGFVYNNYPQEQKDVATISVNDKTNLGTLVPIELGSIQYRLNAYLLVGKETIKLGGKDTWLDGPTVPIQSTEGFCEKIVPVQVDIRYKGDTTTLKLDESTNNYGGGEKPITIQRNELRQSSNTILDKNTNKYIDANKHLANRVISEYQNGKETATVLVSVSEYYDENGNLAISTKKNDLPMAFRVGDLVIPQTYGADGNDYPMSRNKDGSAKVFRVVGRKTYFDGAVWQELSLQEFDKSNL